MKAGPFRLLVGIALASLALTALPPAGLAAGPVPAARHSQSAYTVPRCDIFEITLTLAASLPPTADPFTDVEVSVHFTGPDGRLTTIGGFYYDGDLWKARLAPDQVGDWTYSYQLRGPAGLAASGRGAFTCAPSDRPGFLRPNPANPFTWVFDNGDPFWPVGLQDCVGDHNENGTILDTFTLEGGDRHGPWVASPSDVDTYLRAYALAGFNLFRFSQQNCSYAQYRDLDHYLPLECIWTDQLLEKLRHHGYRIFYGFFGYGEAFTQDPDDPAKMADVKRFLKYSVDRWGAYVDLWELLNEQDAHDRWTTMMAEHVRSIDPYHHPVTTSWEHPELDPIDVNAPHWYELENWWDSDTLTAEKAREWKRFGKPVIVGEQGNRAGATWDYTSAMRMRIRLWTALFSEISFVFWNTSYAPNGHHMNIYLGAEERQYVRVLQDFSAHLDPAMKPAPVTPSDEAIRAYALASDERAAVYLRNQRGGRLPENAAISLDLPCAGRGYWIDPADGRMLASVPVPAGRRSLPVPEFRSDLALLVAPGPLSSPPVPVIGANPQFGLAGHPVVLDGSKSVGAFGRAIASYQWDFGDGETADGAVAAHVYPYGSYLATLTVTDAAGAASTAAIVIRAAASQVAEAGAHPNLPEIAVELDRTKPMTEANRAPVAAVTAAPVSGPAPLAVSFHGEGRDADGVVAACHWDFGDGAGADALDAQHLYSQPGAYTATLTVTDDDQATGRATITITVGPPPAPPG